MSTQYSCSLKLPTTAGSCISDGLPIPCIHLQRLGLHDDYEMLLQISIQYSSISCDRSLVLCLETFKYGMGVNLACLDQHGCFDFLPRYLPPLTRRTLHPAQCLVFLAQPVQNASKTEQYQSDFCGVFSHRLGSHLVACFAFPR